MGRMQRLLPERPFVSLDQYTAAGGGRGLDAARTAEPGAVVDEVEASGLRGRGGAGFPTATKWRAVLEYEPPHADLAVVVNAAEGEPGSFKDRAVISANPYAVLEGALIACTAVGADRVVVGMKAAFTAEGERLAAALEEIQIAGWCDSVDVALFAGPGAYLLGE